MKRIAMIAFAVALGLSWTGAAIPADIKQETKEISQNQVRSAQQALADKGYNPGPVDGRMGPETRAAVKDFQRKEGLEPNGRLDMTTMSRLGSTNGSPSASPVTQPQKP